MTFACMAPAVLSTILNYPDRAKHKIATRPRFAVAGAPPPAAFIERLEKELGWEFIADLRADRDGADPHRLDAGLRTTEPRGLRRGARAPACEAIGVEIQVLDDDGKPVPKDDRRVGEVCARSNVVFKGYWRQPEETAKAIHDGYFHTGDLGVWDECGNIHIVDRKKDVIISGGENISSPEIEDALYQHPARARVRGDRRAEREVGRDAEGAHRAAARGDRDDRGEIIEFCRERLAHFKCPTSVEFVVSCRARRPASSRSSSCARATGQGGSGASPVPHRPCAVPEARSKLRRAVRSHPRATSGSRGLRSRRGFRSAPLEVLHRALVPLRRLARLERPEVAPPTRPRVLLARVEAIAGRAELADHVFPCARRCAPPARTAVERAQLVLRAFEHGLAPPRELPAGVIEALLVSMTWRDQRLPLRAVPRLALRPSSAAGPGARRLARRGRAADGTLGPDGLPRGRSRAFRPRRAAADLACRARARGDAAACRSRASALRVARERVLDTRRLRPLPLRTSRSALSRVRAGAVPGFGGASFTPARRALESPIAIACFVDRAPCFPSRMWCISSRTNSPACVLGDLPALRSRSARSSVFFSGMTPPPSHPIVRRCKTRAQIPPDARARGFEPTRRGAALGALLGDQRIRIYQDGRIEGALALEPD